jgi:hypothetical protein
MRLPVLRVPELRMFIHEKHVLVKQNADQIEGEFD